MPTTIRSRTIHATSVVAIGATCILAGACASSQEPSANPAAPTPYETTIVVVPASEVRWGALNPARGDQGPRAADLWGDRTGSGATGFVVRFADGFASPPHIHNTTYRGVVIEGLIHNDDPGAVELWMPPGSYWTQPAGEVHITSAKGSGRLAYIEIQHGPYLVLPTEEASDNPERSVNLHASSMVWLDASSAARIDQPAHAPPADGPKISYLWGDPQDQDPSAALVELPAGFRGALHGHGPSLRIVVINGRTQLLQPDDSVTLDPGSYVGSQSGVAHRIALSTDEACVLYVRNEGVLDIISGQPR